MPPKVKVTKKMVVDASFEVVRANGHENLNARTISEYLGWIRSFISWFRIGDSITFHDSCRLCEEMIFRGFLFRAMLSKDKTIVAIIVSAVTFGIGHIVNLFSGQASFETVMQIIFAISWGFILTMVCYKAVLSHVS